MFRPHKRFAFPPGHGPKKGSAAKWQCGLTYVCRRSREGWAERYRRRGSINPAPIN